MSANRSAVKSMKFFERLGEEIPGVILHWTSRLEETPSNVIITEVTLEEHLAKFNDVAGVNAYGAERAINQLDSSEWVHSFSFRKTLLGNAIVLETRL